jgi:hypothetical protein
LEGLDARPVMPGAGDVERSLAAIGEALDR